ncbi:MAG TPA: hypothetical protein VN476_16850 [Pyrinomonadaceae bacterium]|nr:hypothetical protein [Pyrinomonadaceae bacterium]
MRISTTVLTFAFILALAAFGFGLVLHALTYAGVDARAFMLWSWAAIWLFDHVVNRTELLQHSANLKSRVSGKTV